MAIEAREGLAFLNGMNLIQGSVPPNPKDNRWSVNNSTFGNYFEPVTLSGYHEDVLEVLEQHIGLSEENSGIDIGGGSKGIALRGLIDHGLIGKGLVTNLGKRGLVTRLMSGRMPNVDFISGDILMPETWEKLAGWQEKISPEGVALIMHRPFGGMQDFTASFYKGAVHRTLDMIRPGGAMFTQIPTDLRDLGEGWPMAIDGNLEEICESINQRPDVAEVIPSKEPFAQAKPKHAVILMK